MPSKTTGVLVNVPRPVAVFLETAYVILLGLGILASVSTAGCLLWNYLGIGWPMSTSFGPRTTSDEIRYKDEESGEERIGLEFEDDTEEEYMRRPY